MLHKYIYILLFISMLSCRKAEDVVPVLPEITLIRAFSINPSTALARGILAEATSDAADEYGIVWGQSPEPDISGNGKAAPYTLGVTAFSFPLENLVVGQTYYVRAYIRKGNVVAY